MGDRLFGWSSLDKSSAKLSHFVMHRGLIISIMQAVFSAVFYFAPIALYQGFLMVGYSTIYTMAPVFSLVLDRDVTDEMALMYPELYRELLKGRAMSVKNFLLWVLVSLYQGGTIMLLSLALFDRNFTNIVAISFTSLVLNELLMVAYEIRTWHSVMIYAETVTLLVYAASMAFLPEYFDMSVILTVDFWWKVGVITLVSCAPLFAFKWIRHRFAPPDASKLAVS